MEDEKEYSVLCKMGIITAYLLFISFAEWLILTK